MKITKLDPTPQTEDLSELKAGTFFERMDGSICILLQGWERNTGKPGCMQFYNITAGCDEWLQYDEEVKLIKVEEIKYKCVGG